MRLNKIISEPALFFNPQGVVGMIAKLHTNNDENVISVENPAFLCGMYGVCVATRIIETKDGEIFKEIYILHIDHINTNLYCNMIKRKKVQTKSGEIQQVA